MSRSPIALTAAVVLTLSGTAAVANAEPSAPPCSYRLSPPQVVQLSGTNVVTATLSPEIRRIEGSGLSDGAIRVTVAEAGRSASGSGRLVGNNGGGQWRTSTGQCAGQWTAVRRG